MRLGCLELTARRLDDFSEATLLRAYTASQEPQRGLVLLAALGLCTEGPEDWPSYAGAPYAEHGQRVRLYLEAKNVPIRQALSAGLMAISAISQRPGVTDEEAEEMAAFFGVTAPAGSDDSGSRTGTAETPSAG